MGLPAPAHPYFMFYDTTPTPGTAPVPCQGSRSIVQAAGAGLNLFSTGALLFVAGAGQDSFRNAGAKPIPVQAHFKLMVENATDAVPPMLGATVFTNATPATASNTANSAIPLF